MYFSDYNEEFRVYVCLLNCKILWASTFVIYHSYSYSMMYMQPVQYVRLEHSYMCFDIMYQWSVLARIFRVRVCILIH